MTTSSASVATRKSRRQAQPAVEWFGWESTKERPPAEALEGADAVIHLAGEPINQRWNDEVKDRIARSRIKSTKNMAQAINSSDSPPSVFLSGSAIGYYGDRGDDLLYEDAGPGDDFLAGVVVEWEAAADTVNAEDTRVAKIRTGHVLDPTGGLLGELLTPFKLGVGGPIASGKQYMSWIHRDDEVGHSALGAGERSRERTGQRDRAESGDQQGVRQETGQGGQPPRVHADPGIRARRDAWVGVRQRAARRAAGLPAASQPTTATSSSSPTWPARWPTCCAEPRAAGEMSGRPAQATGTFSGPACQPKKTSASS